MNKSIATVGFIVIGAFTSRSDADDVIRLGGADATTRTLQLSPTSDADTVPVFHKHKHWGCGWGCWCKRPIIVATPVYSGCFGGFGGCYGGNGGGYSAPPTSACGYASPAYVPRAVAPLPSIALVRPPVRRYAIAPVAPRAIVELPRLGLSFSFGSGDGQLANRTPYGIPFNGRFPRDEDTAPPPPAMSQPEPFQYDGGPANPIPLPGATRAAPVAPPAAAPILNNRVSRPVAKPAWLAYGETPKGGAVRPLSSLVVTTRER
jgi:hypothetical protein